MRSRKYAQTVQWQEGGGPLRIERGSDDRLAVGRMGGGSRLVAASAHGVVR